MSVRQLNPLLLFLRFLVAFALLGDDNMPQRFVQMAVDCALVHCTFPCFHGINMWAGFCTARGQVGLGMMPSVGGTVYKA